MQIFGPIGRCINSSIYKLRMTEDELEFLSQSVTLELSDALAKYALTATKIQGGDPIAALFGAALETIRAIHGDHYVIPFATHWLEMLTANSFSGR